MSHHVHVQEFSEPRVSGNTIRGVKIIGTESRDRSGKILYRYPQAVLRKRIGMYDGAPVFIDHRDEREKRANTRNLWAHFGHLVNVRERGDPGLFGDLVVRESHPMAREVLEAAENNPKFGLSSDVFVSMNDAETEVTDLLELYSVDLVDHPGTTKNLFEGNMETNTETTPAGDDKGDALQTMIDARFEAMEATIEKIGKLIEGKKVQESADGEQRIRQLEPAGEGDNAEAVPVVKTHKEFVVAMGGYA